MNDVPSDFYRPRLHLVIAEDDPLFGDYLENYFTDQFNKWGLYRIKQFDLVIHLCPTVKRFMTVVGDLLRKPIDTARTHDLVYATLDMQMPLDLNGDPRDMHGQTMLRWCMDRRNESPRIANRFEFCVISGEDDMLDRMAVDPSNLGEHIRRSAVKIVYKRWVRSEAGDMALDRIWPNVRDFVRHHMRFCEVERQVDDELANKRLLWFGDSPALSRLLFQADNLGGRSEGGIYLIFADTGGYENDWFRLICHLRGVQPRFRGLSTDDDNWEKEIRKPPAALMINHIEHATAQGHDLAEAMRRHEFFKRARDNNSLVFFQFPFLATPLSIRQRLEPLEFKALQACQEAVYEKVVYSEDEGTGFALPKHDNVFPFPSFETLKQAGVIRQTIAYQSQRCRQLLGMGDAAIDPEVIEVLSEMPWDEYPLSLSSLQNAIISAHQGFQNSLESSPQEQPLLLRYIGIQHFPGSKRNPVKPSFDNELGFRVRGKQLYNLLAQPQTQPYGDLIPLDGSSFFKALVAVHELFDRLQRLMDLKAAMQEEKKEVPSAEDFQLDVHFHALQKAHSFLQSLFGTPHDLGTHIANFHPHSTSPQWREHITHLQARPDWWEIIESTRLDWPINRFPLHWAIDAYLRHYGIFAEIHTNVREVLPRYPILQAEWEELERRRRELLTRLHVKEGQRRQAIQGIRFDELQPAALHLETNDEQESVVDGFSRMLSSLVFFNAYAAACENYYLFEGKVCEGTQKGGRTSELQMALRQPELGPCIHLLRVYLQRLARPTREGEIRLDRSIFRDWGIGWAHASKQADASHLAADLARRILEKYEKTLTPADKDSLTRLIRGDEAEGCSGIDMLDALRVLRNNFVKLYESKFWAHYQADLFDLMRRFVTATRKASRRLVELEAEHAYPWSPRQPYRHQKFERQGTRSPQVLWMMEVDPPGHEPLFPVCDLMRIRPEHGSLWVYYSGGRWLNLTSLAGSSEEHQLVDGPTLLWLPSRAAVESTPVWRHAHGD